MLTTLFSAIIWSDFYLSEMLIYSQFRSNGRRNSTNFFMEDHERNKDLMHALEKLCGRLTFISETDSPVVPFTITSENDNVDAEFTRMMVSRKREPIKELDSAAFFDRLTQEREWHTDREKKASANYAKLEKFLRENLNGLRVYRVGSIRVDIYVAGHSSPNTIVGVRTMAVET